MMIRPVWSVFAALILVSACTAGGGAGSSDDGGSTASPPVTSGEPGSSGGAVLLPASITDPIVTDAAASLGVDPSAVTIVAAHEQTFPDGSLGCPEPGMMYTQALVDGYQVIVEVNGTQFDYRGGGSGPFRLCENP